MGLNPWFHRGMTAINVRPLGEDDWQTYRDMRLAALEESPEAFAASAAKEREFDEEHWRKRMNRSRRLVAETAEGKPVGIVSLRTDHREGEDTPYGELFSLWVRPELRGEGVASQLLEALLKQARSEHLGAVVYWVGTDNARGVAFASSKGFFPTEHRRPMALNTQDTESTEEAAFVYPLATDPSEVPSSVLETR